MAFSESDLSDYNVRNGLYSSVYDYTRKWRNPISSTKEDLIEKFTGVTTSVLHKSIEDAYSISQEEGDKLIDSLASRGQEEFTNDHIDEYPFLLDGISKTYRDKFGVSVSPKDIKTLLLKSYIEDSINLSSKRPKNKLAEFMKTPLVDFPASLAANISDATNFGIESSALGVLSTVAPYSAGAILGVYSSGKIASHADYIGRAIGSSGVVEPIKAFFSSKLAKGFLALGGGILGTYIGEKLIDHYVNKPINDALGIENESPSLFDVVKNISLLEAGFFLLKRFPLISIGLYTTQGLLKILNKLNFKDIITKSPKETLGKIKGSFEKIKTDPNFSYVKDKVSDFVGTMTSGQKIAAVAGSSISAAMLFNNTVGKIKDSTNTPDPFSNNPINIYEAEKIKKDLGIDVYKKSLDDNYNIIQNLSNGYITPKHLNFFEKAINHVNYIMLFTNQENRIKYRDIFKSVIDQTLNSFYSSKKIDKDKLTDLKNKINLITNNWYTDDK